MQRRILFLTLLTPAVLAVAATAYGSLAAGGGPIMGPTSTISRPAFNGYYDGHKDTYLNTDVSDKAEAKAMHINYAPVLKTVPLKSAPEIYLVQGKAAGGQLAVFGSQPGETSYSPVWKETILTWKASATPVLITSDTQINKLEKKGTLTERSTSIRLNCPIIKVG
jgi:hypothetical protein